MKHFLLAWLLLTCALVGCVTKQVCLLACSGFWPACSDMNEATILSITQGTMKEKCMSKRIVTMMLMGLMMAGLLAMPATANLVDDAIANTPGSELTILEIYNAYTGGGATANDLFGLYVTTSTWQNVSEVEWLNLAHEAGWSQTVGYYEVGNNANRTNLFTVPPTGANGITPIAPAMTIGFFDLVQNSSYYYSEDALNPGGLTRMIAFLIGGDDYDSVAPGDSYTSTYLLAFEDGRDWDYNDVVFVATITGTKDPRNGDDPIPEPATMALLGMGMIGIMLRKRFVA